MIHGYKDDIYAQTIRATGLCRLLLTLYLLLLKIKFYKDDYAKVADVFPCYTWFWLGSHIGSAHTCMLNILKNTCMPQPMTY